MKRQKKFSFVHKRYFCKIKSGNKKTLNRVANYRGISTIISNVDTDIEVVTKFFHLPSITEDEKLTYTPHLTIIIKDRSNKVSRVIIDSDVEKILKDS